MVKYDYEIGERSKRLKQYILILCEESAMLATWKEQFEKQETLYNRIQADKEAEELKYREELILLFMMNRAARIIQRYYRRILDQRKSKRKGKGKKGGKGKR